MTDPRTDSVVQGLIQDLEPVRPVPRLRNLGIALVLVFAVAVVMNLLWVGLTLAPSAAWQRPSFLILLAGLAATASGSLLAAAAGAIPGREVAVRAGRGLAVLGAVAATLGGVLGVVLADGAVASLPFPWGATAMCASRAGALGTVPAAMLCIYLARAFERRPGLGSVFVCVGAVALGSAVVHASCPSQEGLHLFLGHWVAPAGLALVLALPCSLLIQTLDARLNHTGDGRGVQGPSASDQSERE